MTIRMSEKLEDEELCLKVSGIISYYQTFKVSGRALIDGLSDEGRDGQDQQRLDQVKVLTTAGVKQFIEPQYTSMVDDVHAVGAVEFTTVIPGAERIRVYTFPDEVSEEKEWIGPPKVEGGNLEAYLSQICGEGESMVVAVPSTDYHDPYVFYRVGDGTVEQLNVCEGDPLTGELEFYPPGLDT